MSHVVCNVSALITDLDILERTLAEKFPKLRLARDQKTWEWVGRFFNDYHQEDAAYRNGIAPETYGHGDHALCMEDVAFEVGLVPVKRENSDGYCLVWDFVGSGREITAYIGKGAEKLMTEYARMTAVVTAESQGMTLIETELPNGELEILMTKY